VDPDQIPGAIGYDDEEFDAQAKKFAISCLIAVQRKRLPFILDSWLEVDTRIYILSRQLFFSPCTLSLGPIVLIFGAVQIN